MNSPTSMVEVSLLSSVILLVGIFIWKIMNPKKKINFFFLTLLLSLPPVISIFRPGVYESGDFNIHLYRSIVFFNSLKEGNFMPSWAAQLNAGYGYPLFIFNYNLPYYFISLIKLLGLSFILSMKTFLAFNFVLSGLGMYLFARKEYKKELIAFFVALLYLFAPYHLIDLHFKVVIGEVMSFTVLPFVFLFLRNYFDTKKISYLVLSSVAFGLLIMSHIIIALFSSVLITAYVTLLTKNKIGFKIFTLFSIFALGGLISLPEWSGSLIYSKFSFINIMKIETPYFPKIYELLYSPWRLGFLFQGPKGEISFIAGYTHLFILVLALFLLFKQKLVSKRASLFWIAVSLILIFFITEPSKKLWEFVTVLRIVGPQRLLVLLAFSTSMLAGSIFDFFAKKKILTTALVLLTIYSTMLNWGQRRMIEDVNDQKLISNLPYATIQGEAHFYANTRWVDPKNPWFAKPAIQQAEIIAGKGNIVSKDKTSTMHSYHVVAQSDLKIKENTLYFPGWSVAIKNQKLPIKPGERGTIVFTLPKGEYDFSLKYNDVSLYKITKLISVLTIITAGGFLLFPLLKRFSSNNK